MGKRAMFHIARHQEASWGCLFFAFMLSAPVMAAPVIEELVPLDFGVLAITANDSVSTFTFPRTGNVAIEGTVVLVEKGQLGRYFLSGFPPNTSIDVEADNTDLTAGGTGTPEPLAAGSYDFNDLRTDDFGEAELLMGGTLSTSGNGGTYEDAPYSGPTQLRFRYWQPEEEAFVTNTLNIDLLGEVRTTLAIEEVQVMHFGTLFARTTPDDQASMTLSPGGAVSVSNPGDARIVSLSTPSPGALLITGAAPNRDLIVEPDSADVVLERQTNPAGAPHFILTGLSSDPQGTGRTDENGVLEILVGGTLNTQATADTLVYPSGVYEGTYQMTISY